MAHSSTEGKTPVYTRDETGRQEKGKFPLIHISLIRQNWSTSFWIGVTLVSTSQSSTVS